MATLHSACKGTLCDDTQSATKDAAYAVPRHSIAGKYLVNLKEGSQTPIPFRAVGVPSTSAATHEVNEKPPLVLPACLNHDTCLHFFFIFFPAAREQTKTPNEQEFVQKCSQQT